MCERDEQATLWYWIGFQEALGRESAKRIGGDVDRSDFEHCDLPTDPHLLEAYHEGTIYGRDERRSESLDDGGRDDEEWEPDF